MVVCGNRVVLVAVLVTAFLVGPACGENVKDCTVDKTCEVEPKRTLTSTTTTTTTETKKTLTTSEPKKTTTITNPKKIATTVTTAKTPSKTTVVALGDVLRRYNVSGNDSSDRSAPLKEIVVLDVPVTPDGGDTNVNGSGNATASVVGPGEVVIKSDGKAATGTTSLINSTNTTTALSPAVANSNVTVTNVTINNATVATTESTRALPPNVAKNGAQVAVRFVTNKYCYCDIVSGGCDMNCCCDTDCTNHDLKSFTSCSDQVENNLIKPVSILFDSSLFYVVVENVPSDYFYPEREPIQSESKIEASLRKREVFTWNDEKSERPSSPPARMDSTFNSFDLTYRSVRWMYTAVSDVNSTEIKTFSLKNGALNSLCSVDQPVEYLVQTNTSCQTFVRNLKDACNNDSSLSYKHYFGDNGLFKVLQPVYSSVHKTEKFVLVTVRATARHRCVSANDCDGGPPYHPVYSSSMAGGVCRGAVVSVEYRVEHNGTRGARALEVHFGHADVTDARRPAYVGHRFGVLFATRPVAAEPRRAYRRSGKPGYAAGVPVLVAQPPRDAGRRTTATDPEGRRPEPMTLPEPDGRGLCQAAAGRRRPVNFLENVEVRCRVPVMARAEESTAAAATDFCRDVQNRTLAALGDFEGALVASLGDPDVAQWIPTVVVKPPPPLGDHQHQHVCPSVMDGVHVRVLYSHAGAFDRPRATVLGVSVNYTGSAVAVTDRPPYVSLRASAVFVDLTRPPVRTFAEPPTYEFRLPEDFYYPFWSSDTGSGFGTVTGASAAAAARFSHVPTMFLSAVVCTWYASASCR